MDYVMDLPLAPPMPNREYISPQYNLIQFASKVLQLTPANDFWIFHPSPNHVFRVKFFVISLEVNMKTLVTPD